MSAAANDNARSIGSAISNLRDHLSSKRYKDFWHLVKEINELFKTLKPLSNSDRAELWDSFSSLCTDAKSQQEEFWARSEKLKDNILGDVSVAQPPSFVLSDSDLRDSLKDLGIALNRAGKKLSEHKCEMATKHKQECFDAIQSMRGRHNECWDRVKSDQTNKKYRSEHLKNDILSDVEHTRPCEIPCTPFGVLDINIDEMKALSALLAKAGNRLHDHREEMFGEHKQECFNAILDMRKVHDVWWDELRRRRNEHYENKKSEIRTKIMANLENNRGRLYSAASNLEKMRASKSDLEDKISSAWNDDFRERAEGWLSELNDKIGSVEEYIDRIEAWIREDEEKLNSL